MRLPIPPPGSEFLPQTGLIVCRNTGSALHPKGIFSPMSLSALPLSRLLLLTGAVGLAAGAGLVGASSGHAQPAPVDEYTTIVKPILAANCIRCHSEVKHKGGLVLETRAGILKGGAMDGPVIVPGHPEQSLLVKLIRHEGPANDPMPMPPPPHTQLSPSEIAAITQWIKDGAVIPQ